VIKSERKQVKALRFVLGLDPLITFQL